VYTELESSFSFPLFPFDPFGYRCRSAIIIQSKSAMSRANLKDFHDLVISRWYH
jgi:hypothetical protein